VANLIVEVPLERQMVEAIARAGPSGLNNVKVGFLWRLCATNIQSSQLGNYDPNFRNPFSKQLLLLCVPLSILTVKSLYKNLISQLFEMLRLNAKQNSKRLADAIKKYRIEVQVCVVGIITVQGLLATCAR
jgi:hypothetical protein